jgi:hypothetical protein
MEVILLVQEAGEPEKPLTSWQGVLDATLCDKFCQ